MCIMVSSICLLFSAGMVVGQTLKANSPQVPNSAHLALSDTVQEEWVQHYTSGIGVDYASAIAIDQLGNVYVTGKSEGYNSGYDYLTIKYDASGTEEWVARYNGPGSGDDEATAISVDADGNVYVGGGSGGDYATIKYNSSGAEQWVARYNGPGNADDFCTALAVDAAGNVYVTGYSLGSGTGYDYTTVKYNSAGVEQWVMRYNGPGNADDYAVDIAVDEAGYVHVTGKSFGAGTGYDYATVKYNASGVEQWVTRYTGVGNYDDYATALALDGSGNVYVTGGGYDSSTWYDYTTIKYNSSGVEQWVRYYNGPQNGGDYATAIAIDESGNVYVTGGSTGTWEDYATVKYNSTGVEQWVARYNGPRNLADRATGLAVDTTGDVYVTGWTYDWTSAGGAHLNYTTILYDGAGVEQWIAHYNGSGYPADQAMALAIDATGNVYVTGQSNQDYATVKYDGSGSELWVVRYDGPGNTADNHLTALAVDREGNVYVTGYSASATYYDYATIKYNASGIKQWVARYNGPLNSADVATALTVDAAGNVYVTGVSRGHRYTAAPQYTTIKYNSSGIEQWIARHGTPYPDSATAITVDDVGNVYVTGWSSNGNSYGYTTIKYDPSGIEQWIARYDPSTSLNELPTALAVDANGNVYVTGTTRWPPGTAANYATIKYDATGVEQWVATYTGLPMSFPDVATSLAVDQSGSVYVTGWSIGPDFSYDYATIKYNSSGIEEWVVRYTGAGNSSDYATALVLDANGNVYVTGTSGSDYATIKYSPSGSEQWVARYDGPTNSDDRATSIALDADGNVYVTGYSFDPTTGNDFITIKYTPSGIQQWIARYNGPNNSDDIAVKVAVDTSKNVYVAGSSTLPGSSIYTTIKYSQIVEPFMVMVPYGANWNILSNPVITADDSVRQLFPSSEFPYAFGFTPSGYFQSYRMVNGWGYWEKFAAPGIQNIIGQPLIQDSIEVAAGWNMVGTISHPVDTGTIVSDPPGLRISNWFGYNGGYNIVPTLEPGMGYWVRANGVGRFILNSSPSASRPYVLRNAASFSSALDLNTLTISHPNGGSQTLYFGADADNTIPVTMYTMPPLPPAGAFDARFETEDGGSMVQTYPETGSETREFPITVQAGAYPLTVEWKITGSEAVYELRAGKNIVQTLHGEGTLRIADDAINRLTLRALSRRNALPNEFALEQNYPNPFNPITTIRYALPVRSRVKVEVFNIVGQRVQTPVALDQPAGYHSVELGGTNAAGSQLATGLYFYRLIATPLDGSEPFVQTRKMVLLR